MNHPLTRILFTLILLLGLSVSGHARELSVYNNFLNAGPSINTATANSLLLFDDGVLSLWNNPAGLVTDRHEIYGGGTITGSISTQSQVDPSGTQAGIGMLGYLYNFETGAFALGWAPRNAMEASADFGNVAEIRNTISFSEITASYARSLGRGVTVGVSAGPIIGEGRDGALQDEAEMDTIYSPLLWFARIGVKQKLERIVWGLTIETPAVGKFTVERPVNVGYRRDKTDVDYAGAMGVRAGVGYDLGYLGLQSDLLYYNTDMIQVDGEQAEFDSPLVSMGMAANLWLSEQIELRSGVRVRFEDPYERRFFQWGLGGTYVLTPQVTLYGGYGMLFPYGDGARGSVFEDLRPVTIRAGVLYHSTME